MSEASAWTTLRGHLVGMGGRVHIQRFEDKLTGGIPDTNVCWDPVWGTPHPGIEFWLEGKYVKALPKRQTTRVKVDLRADQALWLETRQRAGGKAFVWIRVADYGWLLFDSGFRELRDGIPLGDFSKKPCYINCREMVRALKVFLISEPIHE